MAVTSSCPNMETLQLFAVGQLSPDQALLLTRHLVRCKFCSDDVRMLQSASKSLAAPTTGGSGVGGYYPPPGLSTDIRPQPAPPTEGRGPLPALPTQGPAPMPTPHIPPVVIARPLSPLYAFLSPPQREDEIGRLGPYRILKILGQGGMGVVFEAEDESLQRRVALKTLHANLAVEPTSHQRFLQEGKSAAAVDHENVVTIYHVGEANGVPYLAMQFLQGRSLEQKLRDQKQLPSREICRIGAEIAHGLAAAHRLRLVHRDIKPSNIWLTAQHEANMATPVDGRVKILDFGLARAMEQHGQGLTQQGLVVGTAGYMSPEQARGHAIDARADLYSLGCVLYEMGTGRLPLEGTDSLATLMATMLDKPEAPLTFNPALPTPLSDLIMKLLAKNPDERPSTAASVAQHLARMAQGPALSLDELRARLMGGRK